VSGAFIICKPAAAFHGIACCVARLYFAAMRNF